MLRAIDNRKGFAVRSHRQILLHLKASVLLRIFFHRLYFCFLKTCLSRLLPHANPNSKMSLQIMESSLSYFSYKNPFQESFESRVAKDIKILVVSGAPI